MWRSLWQTHSWPLFCQAKWEGGQWMPFCILELLLERLVNSDLNRKWKIWALRLHTELSLLRFAICHVLCLDRGSVVSSQRNAQMTKSPPRLEDSSEGSCSWITAQESSVPFPPHSFPPTLWNSSAKCVVENCHQCLQGCRGKRWERILRWESPVGWWISSWGSPITETVQGQAWVLSQVV